jgi:hypothetical protein
MGPYCKFCDSRCFVPTSKEDYVKTDLKATCQEGIKHDMSASFPTVRDSKGNSLGWLIELNRGEEYSMAACLHSGDVMPYEILNKDLTEVHDWINGGMYYLAK